MVGFTGSREWVYAQSVKGRWQKVHRATAMLLHALLFVTPWIPINGHPALRIDLPARRVYALGSIYTASDTIFLMLLLLMAAFSLFFFSSLFGRLWCGYACPQTVFLEEWIRPFERWVEGDRWRRMKRDRHPWTWDWTWRKAVKFTGFAVVAVVISMAFMSFFAGAPRIWTGNGGPVEYGIVAFFAGIWFFDFAWFREQFCNFVCPYARFQGVLTDADSLIVGYDTTRGEPRGKAAKKTGGCVDCNKCVYVCPQGIDIRDGFQLECITCGRCIDACADVQSKLGFTSLIGYSTVVQLAGGTTRLIRPRTVLYASILATLATVFLWTLTSRSTIEASINHVGDLYVLDEDGMVRNTFLLKVANNDSHSAPQTFDITVTGLPDPDVRFTPVTLAATETTTVPVIVRVPAGSGLDRTVPIEVIVTSDSDRIGLKTTFKTPES